MGALRIRPDVAAAVADGRAVVALESTIIAHGLPRPDNLRVAREVEAVVADTGALAVTIGVLDGVAIVGLDDAELVRLASGADVAKLSARDLAAAVAQGRDGATTVASTAVLAARAGIKLFATGGLGGVHRAARDSWDESADLSTLAETAITVVCAGVKSILDVAATLERLESLSVPVVGYRTHSFPGFYLTDSGYPLDWSVTSAGGVARIMRARQELGVDNRALIVANPLPEDEQLDPELHDRVLNQGLARLETAGVQGKGVTPFLLEYFHRETHGASLAANTRIIRHNARLAAQIAVAWAGSG
ncbi:MAG TPA: pseudouridine-5'-phosphate glycosidase [Mycobacteriales bacterium]|nr:pseudouridine-5'-phosphate glycosidase [Mycobacteriales bacterium]